MAVPHLRRETTRMLCNEYTTLFDSSSDLAPAPAAAATVVSVPVRSTKWRSSLDPYSRATPTGSWCRILTPLSIRDTDEHSVSSFSSAAQTDASPTSSVRSSFSPASTTCSETDDSVIFDSLSPPSSPWFSSTLDHSGTSASHITQDPNVVATRSTTALQHDLDFFTNSFYQSLAETDFPKQVCAQHHYQQHSCFQRPPVVSAIRSVRTHLNAHGLDNNGTAAPSELYNVTIDEILSSDPLTLENHGRQMPFLASGASIPITMSDLESSKNTETDQVYNGQTSSQDTVTDQTLRRQSVIEFDGLFDSEGSLSPAMDDDDEDFHDDDEDDKVRNELDGEKQALQHQGNNFDTDLTGVKESKACYRQNSSLKAPRVRKQSSIKTPKVYPPRRPKSSSQTRSQDENETLLVTYEASTLQTDTTSNDKFISTATVLPFQDGSYRCELCPTERFGRVHDLKRHQISKHNEKTWPCDFCHRPFVRRDALFRHYAVKAARKDGIHPTEQESHRLSEARARAKLK